MSRQAEAILSNFPTCPRCLRPIRGVGTGTAWHTVHLDGRPHLCQPLSPTEWDHVNRQDFRKEARMTQQKAPQP